MLKTLLKSAVPLPVLDRLAGRSGHVFALGTPKSGTTSIAGMFKEQCRAGHEALRPATVQSMHDHFRGVIDDEQLSESYRRRDKQLLLNVESNCFLAYRPDILRDTFPDASFVVTIRKPVAWLQSIFDNNLNFPSTKTPTMTQWHEVLFSTAREPRSSNDSVLAELGLYPLRCYVEYWERTYRRCLTALSDSKCMQVGTNQLSARSEEIGRFVDIDLSTVNLTSRERNVTTVKHNVLQRLDGDAVEACIEEVCGSLTKQFELDRLWVQ